MTDVWLAIIALAVAVMAAIQVGAIVLGLRLARRVDHLTTKIEHDIQPLIQNLTDVTAEARRATALATAQVERADRLFGDLAVTAERTVAVASEFVRGPARNGLALVTAARAAFSAFRELQNASRRRRAYKSSAPEDEESLFIG
ncbi:MAG: hypothetical protein KA371_07085 [Acidobacteria bacterium]|nr:hypothetical protein [Acidobacteriota bacterium]